MPRESDEGEESVGHLEAVELERCEFRKVRGPLQGAHQLSRKFHGSHGGQLNDAWRYKIHKLVYKDCIDLEADTAAALRWLMGAASDNFLCA